MDRMLWMSFGVLGNTSMQQHFQIAGQQQHSREILVVTGMSRHSDRLQPCLIFRSDSRWWVLHPTIDWSKPRTSREFFPKDDCGPKNVHRNLTTCNTKSRSAHQILHKPPVINSTSLSTFFSNCSSFHCKKRKRIINQSKSLPSTAFRFSKAFKAEQGRYLPKRSSRNADD